MPRTAVGADHETEYEKIRRENMLSNQKLLEGLMLQKMDCPTGLAAGFAVLGVDEPKPKPKAKKAPKPKVVKPKAEAEDGETVEREGTGSRRSARQASKPVVSYAKDGEGIVDRSKMPKMVSRPDKQWNEDDSDEGEEGEGKVRVNKLVGRVHDPKTFGLIPGVPIGSWWETRAECSAAAIHAPFVAGISGGPEGAYSVALSGGYDDDIDMGDAFTYTGSGGRDLKGTAKNPKNLRTAPQSSHQSFEHSFNKALKVSSETRKPVRVIRGFKLPGVYAPETGYRYDGLYIVERAWMDRGNNPKGWKVCKFAFRRIPGQPPIPVKGKTSKTPATAKDVEMKDTEEDETDGREGKEETEAEEEQAEKEEQAESEEDEEPEEKPKKGRGRPKSKVEAKSKPGPKTKSDAEEQEEEGEEEKPAPKKRGRKPKVEATESTVEVEDKPKRGRKPGPKPKQEEPESEEEPPTKRKPGRPKSKVRSEPESSESVSKRGRKPKAKSEPEEEDDDEESVPPAKKSKVEEASKKRGRPPKNKYKNVYFHKQTKNTWARDDPAILWLVSAALCVSAIAWGLVYSLSPFEIIKLSLLMVIRDFILSGAVVATIVWGFSNTLLLSPSQSPPTKVEWAYTFDVHTNAFFPVFLILHGLQLVLLPVVSRDGWIWMWMGNSVWVVGLTMYVYVTYLGLNALPFLIRTELLLFPLLPLFAAYAVSLLGFNVARWALQVYFGS
ncbi:unnamed protein product [Rhizoctonia solani]|uniref:YDG domain-containing protein n=1 Tax=Rhizoctonia solani TaxID=456999 RepID=A0A8H2WEH2_9AGAM|nr:unnamed protein product [Rhizoctonia solani]